MVAALTCHLQALGLGELTHCLRLCSKILSKVQPPLVSPLALPSGPQAQGLSNSTGNPSNSARDKSRDKEDKRVRKTLYINWELEVGSVKCHVFPRHFNRHKIRVFVHFSGQLEMKIPHKHQNKSDATAMPTSDFEKHCQLIISFCL